MISYGSADMDATAQPSRLAPPPAFVPTLSRGLRRARILLSGLIALVLGLLPHILHHAGPLAGAALFAGVGGSLLFGAIGLLAAVPFLVRLHRRCGNWRLPTAMLALFAAMFSISAFVIGPQISDEADTSASQPANATPAESQQSESKESGHAAHH